MSKRNENTTTIRKPRTGSHDHLRIANHTPNTQRMFFALGQQLGFSSEDLKERAIKKFNTDCFNKLSTADLCELIDRLVAMAEKRGIHIPEMRYDENAY